MPHFSSVVIDVDSTLSQIEGIEWLAGRCEASVRERIAVTTDAAMRGDIPLEAVYGERLALVKPTRAEVRALGAAYIDAIAPGAREAIAAFQQAGVRVAIVSGGLRDAILPLADHVGVPHELVCAVRLQFDDHDGYLDYDRSSPVTRRGGKPDAVRGLGLPAPALAVGDGITDAELRGVVDRFVAFTGVVRHERVVALADDVVTHFSELVSLVIS
jgi:phosphoserine phosphatase